MTRPTDALDNQLQVYWAAARRGLGDWVQAFRGHKVTRRDHHPMYWPVIVGCGSISLSMLAIGPVPNSTISEMSDWMQQLMAFTMLMGSIVTLYGICLGTVFDPLLGFKLLWRTLRRRKPRWPTADIRRAYAWNAAGLPAITTSLTSYAWAIVDKEAHWTSAAGSGLCIGIALGGFLTTTMFIAEIWRISSRMPALYRRNVNRGDYK